jgi:hypothetical protein
MDSLLGSFTKCTSVCVYRNAADIWAVISGKGPLGDVGMSELASIARNVTEQTFANTFALNHAFLLAADLIGYMLTSRQEVGISAYVERPAIEQAIARMPMLDEAHVPIYISGNLSKSPAIISKPRRQY